MSADAANMPPEWQLAESDIHKLTNYHPPTEQTVPKFEAVNSGIGDLLRMIRDNVPPGPRRTRAVNTALDLRMQCNLAISLDAAERSG